MNRSTLRVICVLLFGGLCAILPAACGGDEEGDAGAQQVLAQTFRASSSAIETGRLTARFELEPDGLLALGGPITLRLTGPFAAPARGELPRFDFALAATLANQRFRGAMISTGRKGFLELDGRAYAIDDAFVSKLRKGLGEKSDRPKAGLQALGIDPLRWITGVTTKGNERVAGTDTIRVGGKVDVQRLLADIDRLLTKAGGSGSGGGRIDLLTPGLRKQIADAVETATADVWTGAEDKLLRQIVVAVKFTFKGDEPPPIRGLDGGRIKLRVNLDDLNGAPAKFTAPDSSRPLSQLTGGEGLGAFLRGLGAGITGGTGGDGGSAFLRCVTQADGKSAEIVRCASKLDG